MESRKYAVDGSELEPRRADSRAIIDEFRKGLSQGQALRAFVALEGLRSLHASLERRGRTAFQALFVAYLKIHLPNNPFRIASTRRYLRRDEACIVATHRIEPGEAIQNLCGRRLPLSDAELEALVKAQKDFSVLGETLFCPQSLLAGPVRLLNHSCHPNAELRAMGERFDVTVAARGRIDEGEEITIDYGSEYFGSGNEDCLCGPCRQRVAVGEGCIL